MNTSLLSIDGVAMSFLNFRYQQRLWERIQKNCRGGQSLFLCILVCQLVHHRVWRHIRYYFLSCSTTSHDNWRIPDVRRCLYVQYQSKYRSFGLCFRILYPLWRNGYTLWYSIINKSFWCIEDIWWFDVWYGIYFRSETEFLIFS